MRPDNAARAACVINALPDQLQERRFDARGNDCTATEGTAPN
ncbi:MAG: hypothetical protein RJA05_2109 [Planctomycetota bacterium]